MPDPMPGKVLVVGDVMRDIVVIPEGPIVRGSDRRARIRTVSGGSGANQAVWLAYHDVPTAFCARVGVEDLGALTEEFTEAGVEPKLVGDDALPTGQLVTLVDLDGERSFLTDRGANLNLSLEHLPADWLVEKSLIVLSGYSFFEPGPRETILRICARAKSLGIPFAVDPSSTGFLAEVGPQNFLKWIEGASLLVANEEEASLLAGTDNVAEQISRLAAWATVIVVKQGAAGSSAGGVTEPLVAAHANPVTALDSTGAGDAFLGGYVSAWLGGRGLRERLVAGNAAGAIAVQRIGGRPPKRQAG